MHPKSMYMHKDRNGLLKAGPVWDFDYATFVSYRVDTIINTESPYFSELLKDSIFKRTMKRNLEIYKNQFQDIIFKIDSLKSLVEFSQKKELAEMAH